MSKKQKQLKKVGFITKLHGYKGEVVVAFDKNFEEEITEGFLFVKLDGIPVPFQVEEDKEKNGLSIVRFTDVTNDEYAKRLLKKDVFFEASGKKKMIDEASLDDL